MFSRRGSKPLLLLFYCCCIILRFCVTMRIYWELIGLLLQTQVRGVCVLDVGLSVVILCFCQQTCGLPMPLRQHKLKRGNMYEYEYGTRRALQTFINLASHTHDFWTHELLFGLEYFFPRIRTQVCDAYIFCPLYSLCLLLCLNTLYEHNFLWQLHSLHLVCFSNLQVSCTTLLLSVVGTKYWIFVVELHEKYIKKIATIASWRWARHRVRNTGLAVCRTA